ncbi:hypothetical protein ACOSQ4_007380 [Xanthoceras sorbifolium]
MFKALILDSHNLVPKLAQQSIKSIDVIEGNGEEVGCIKQANFCEGGAFKYMRQRIDALNKDNFLCKYSLIEGDVLGDKIESVVYEAKFEATGNGGCLAKVATEFHVKGDHKIMMEQTIKEGQDLEIGMLKVIETYLLANPEVYA